MKWQRHTWSLGTSAVIAITTRYFVWFTARPKSVPFGGMLLHRFIRFVNSMITLRSPRCCLDGFVVSTVVFHLAKVFSSIRRTIASWVFDSRSAEGLKMLSEICSHKDPELYAFDFVLKTKRNCIHSLTLLYSMQSSRSMLHRCWERLRKTSTNYDLCLICNPITYNHIEPYSTAKVLQIEADRTWWKMIMIHFYHGRKGANLVIQWILWLYLQIRSASLPKREQGKLYTLIHIFMIGIHSMPILLSFGDFSSMWIRFMSFTNFLV